MRGFNKSIIVILCSILYIKESIGEQEIYKIPIERLQLLIEKFAKPCAEKHNLDAAILVRKIGEGTIPRDDIHNEFLYCFALAGNFINEDGHVNIDRFIGIIRENHHLREEMKEALRQCNNIKKENPIQTAVAMNDCIVDTAPISFGFD